MRYQVEIEMASPEAGPPDPSHYLRLADLALLYGSRDEAEALITMAYLAFDSMWIEREDFIAARKVWPGRSN